MQPGKSSQGPCGKLLGSLQRQERDGRTNCGGRPVGTQGAPALPLRGATAGHIPNAAGDGTLPGDKGTQGQERFRPPPVSTAPWLVSRCLVPQVPPASPSGSVPSPVVPDQCPGGAARRSRPHEGPGRSPRPGPARAARLTSATPRRLLSPRGPGPLACAGRPTTCSRRAGGPSAAGALPRRPPALSGGTGKRLDPARPGPARPAPLPAPPP